KLDFDLRAQRDDLLPTPDVRHLFVRQIEWLSEGRLLSSEQSPRIRNNLKDLTLRINGSPELTITKALAIPVSDDDMGRRSDFASRGRSINVELVSTSAPLGTVVFVYSDLPNLVFRSSMSAIDRQAYNSSTSRYEIVVRPVKQLLFAGAEGFKEKSMGVINPQQNVVIEFLVTVASEPVVGKGRISIASDPPDASI